MFMCVCVCIYIQTFESGTCVVINGSSPVFTTYSVCVCVCVCVCSIQTFEPGTCVTIDGSYSGLYYIESGAVCLSCADEDGRYVCVCVCVCVGSHIPRSPLYCRYIP